ncbi:MAG: transcriptional repressor LexA [Deltaproteobacteria bacterium]|nr:transcriptional repressor LexA [Deltaproteobacteria bacterium]
MTPSITPKQKRVLDFVETYSRAHGYAPSQQEIAAEFGFRSLGTVQNYLVRLEASGLLLRSRHGRRSLKVAHAEAEIWEVPLVGRVAAGRPIEAVASAETLEVPPWMLRGGDTFALRVVGDSMIGDGILDGDYVVVRRQGAATNGQTVVALVDGEATVKRFYGSADGVELRAANPAFASIEVRSDRALELVGVVVGVLRRCG